MVRHHGQVGYRQKKSPVLAGLPDFIFLLNNKNLSVPLRYSVKVKTEEKRIVVPIKVHHHKLSGKHKPKIHTSQ
jgi:hypothetical protein